MSSVCAFVRHYYHGIDCETFIALKRTCHELYNVCSAVEAIRSKQLLRNMFRDRLVQDVDLYMNACSGRHVLGNFNSYVYHMMVVTNVPFDMGLRANTIRKNTAEYKINKQNCIKSREGYVKEIIRTQITVESVDYEYINIVGGMIFQFYICETPNVGLTVGNKHYYHIMKPNGRICPHIRNPCGLIVSNAEPDIFARAIINGIDYIDKIEAIGRNWPIVSDKHPHRLINRVMMKMLANKNIIEGDDLAILKIIAKNAYLS